MKSTETDGVLVCYPTGRIDITNADAFEQELNAALAEHPGAKLVLDAGELEYISSAGLRAIKRLRIAMKDRNGSPIVLRGVRPDIMEVFEMTGFSAMLQFE